MCELPLGQRQVLPYRQKLVSCLAPEAGDLAHIARRVVLRNHCVEQSFSPRQSTGARRLDFTLFCLLLQRPSVQPHYLIHFLKPYRLSREIPDRFEVLRALGAVEFVDAYPIAIRGLDVAQLPYIDRAKWSRLVELAPCLPVGTPALVGAVQEEERIYLQRFQGRHEFGHRPHVAWPLRGRHKHEVGMLHEFAQPNAFIEAGWRVYDDELEPDCRLDLTNGAPDIRKWDRQ